MLPAPFTLRAATNPVLSVSKVVVRVQSGSHAPRLPRPHPNPLLSKVMSANDAGFHHAGFLMEPGDCNYGQQGAATPYEDHPQQLMEPVDYAQPGDIVEYAQPQPGDYPQQRPDDYAQQRHDVLQPSDLSGDGSGPMAPAAPAAPAGFRSPVKTMETSHRADWGDDGDDGVDGDDEAEAGTSQTSPDGSPTKKRKKTETKRIRPRRMSYRSAEHSGHHTVSPVARAARGGWAFSRLLDVRLLHVGQPAGRALTSTVSLCVIGGSCHVGLTCDREREVHRKLAINLCINMTPRSSTAGNGCGGMVPPESQAPCQQGPHRITGPTTSINPA